MERKKRVIASPIVVVTPDAPQNRQGVYRKLGGGSLRIANRIVKPGETIKIDPSQIPAPFRDLFEEISAPEVTTVEEELKPIPSSVTYSLKRDKDVPAELGKKYHIISSAGKVLTEESLPKDEADQLLKAVN